MNLIFSYVHPNRSGRTLGPFRSVRFSVDGMRADADDRLVASYHKHQWGVEGLDYFRLDCTSRVVIHFERKNERSSPYGPFERFSAVNGLAYGDDHVLTFLDFKEKEWLYYDTGYHWPNLVVTDVMSAR
jgi:hypothetical protein